MSAPTAAATAETTEERPGRPWFSGFCGPGEVCHDERVRNKAGEVVRQCRYRAENGDKAPRKYLYCACPCHLDPERAGQAVTG